MTVNLGSPNGLAVGYFLAQHKRQLGGKYVSKINVFKADTNIAALIICLLFTIEDRIGASTADIDGYADGIDRVDEGVVVKRSNSGSSIVREHVVWTRL